MRTNKRTPVPKASFIRTETSCRHMPNYSRKRIRHKKIEAVTNNQENNINTEYSMITLISYIYLFMLLIAGIIALIH
jgi:hypothetical protein